jgi:hypothetical protein
MSTLTERRAGLFWKKVRQDGECWTWTACLNKFGYGWFNSCGEVTTQFAHRIAWIELRGPIPEGLELDHLCRNRACVNPDHLEPVPHGENVRRGDLSEAARKWNGDKAECLRGHPLNDEANAYVDARGRRNCRACAALRARTNRAKAVARV